MQNNFDVVIIGGGLAGLTAAIHLSKAGLSVSVIEKNEYPTHKVCGEYLSNEVLPYLNSLGFNPFDFGAKKIDRFQLSSLSGKLIETKLPLGGFGISRYCLDEKLALFAKENGTSLIHEKVQSVSFSEKSFLTKTNDGSELKSKVVLGAFGKRSNIDTYLKRIFIQNTSPYIAVKAHYSGDFPDDLVAIHNFKGGYCGVSKVENDHINICYITNYNTFKKYKNIQDFQSHVLIKNVHLKSILNSTKLVFDKPLTISQISFSKKRVVDKHILMCGDSAGMIHPICGNGMSMAIHSAKICSESILSYLHQTIRSHSELEMHYANKWKFEFQKRLKTGRVLSKLFELNHFSEFMMFGLKTVPRLLPKIIKQTHGKPIEF